jgi:hypothetical protein
VIRRFLLSMTLAGNLLAQSAPVTPANPAPHFEIRGTLVNSVSGQHIAGADIALTIAGGQRDSGISMTTDDDGHFLFSGLEPGKYMLTAQRHGYVGQAFEAHDGFFTSIVVGMNLDSSNILFRISPECSISGAVVDEAGEPVEEAWVRLYQTGQNGSINQIRYRSETVTNDLGAYHFGHLPPGKYFVSASARVWYAQHPSQKPGVIMTTYSGVSTGYSPYQLGPAPDSAGENGPVSPLDVAYPLTFYPSTADISEATPILLKNGERFIADLSLQPQPALHFTIVGTDSKAYSYPILEYKLPSGIGVPLTAEMRTDASGSIEVVGALPGQYTMKFNGQNEAQRDFVREINVSSNGLAALQEISGARVDVALTEGAGAIRGQKRYLQMTNQKTNESFTESIPEKGDVEFKKAVPAGVYELAMGNSGSMYIQSITAVGAKVSGRAIEIRGKQDVKLNLSFAQGKAEITGTVMSNESFFAGVMVLLVPTDPAHNAILFRRDQSNSDGSFRLPGAIPGRYTVVAIEKGWELEWRNPDVLKPYIAGGTPVEVKPGGRYYVKVTLQ